MKVILISLKITPTVQLLIRISAGGLKTLKKAFEKKLSYCQRFEYRKETINRSSTNDQFWLSHIGILEHLKN